MLGTKSGCAAILVLLLMSGCNQQKPERKISYPASKTVDVVEDYHGTKVADPYRWMEDLDSKEVADWVRAQNDVTNRQLAALPMREHFKERITQLWDYPKTGIPRREGGRYFYSKNSGLQAQSVLYALQCTNEAIMNLSQHLQLLEATQLVRGINEVVHHGYELNADAQSGANMQTFLTQAAQHE